MSNRRYGLQKLIRALILLLTLVLDSGISFAQFYPAKVYSIQDGMPANSIYDITQSADGVMWFVSSKGIMNYNSLDWQLFPDSLQLPNSPFSIIKSLSDGTVWVAGQNSKNFVVKYYKGNEWFDLLIQGLPRIGSSFTLDIKNSDEGYQLLLTHAGFVYTYDTQKSLLAKFELPLVKGAKVNSSLYKDDDLLICTSEGLFTMEKGFRPSIINQSLTEGKEILQVHWQNDVMYLLGIGWLARYDSGRLQYLSKDTGIKKRSPYNKHNLTIDRLGRIFYSSRSAAKYHDEKLATGKILYINGRVLNFLSNRIFVDKENNVWIGDHRGLFKFNVLGFQNYNENTQLAFDEVSSIFKYDNQIILANPGYLNFLENGEVTKSVYTGNGDGTRVLDIAQNSDGSLLIAGAEAGLLIYDGQRLKNTEWGAGSHETNVTSVELCGSVLYFSSDRAIYAWNDSRVERKIDVPGIRNLQYLNSDTLAALSTSQGFLFYNLSTMDTVRYRSSDRDYNNIFSITTWRGRYYLATAGGVATIQDDRIVPANLSEKLKKVSIYNFLVDGTDRLWMGSNEGVFIWDGDKLINYNQTHGLIGNDVNRNALLMEGDGRIWIGTEMGASVYDISTDLIARIKPIVHFEEIVSQKGTIIEGESNSLEYDDNTVEFDFLGISFFDEKQITYRYQLEGFDADWLYIDNPNAHSIRYTNLPPAEYRFNVQAGIGSTQWSDTISQDFEILQPFYSKTWFVILSIICSLIILYFIYRIRFFVILKKQKKLRRLVKMRTQEIEEKNEKLMLQSEQIFTINEKLEDTVNERTHQLQEQNSILVEYAFINSHELRGPICRILGLLELIGKTNDEEKEKIIAMIRTTGIELDEVSRSINSMLDNVDMGNLEYYKNIEQGNPSAQKTERGDNLESDND